jgi:hypothetical protein
MFEDARDNPVTSSPAEAMSDHVDRFGGIFCKDRNAALCPDEFGYLFMGMPVPLGRYPGKPMNPSSDI